MKYLISGVLILFAALALISIGLSCGKSSRKSFSGTGIGIGLASGPQVEVLSGTGGLRPPVHFEYDYTRYPSQLGFSVVPMQDDLTPFEPGAIEMDLSATTKGSEASISLSASNTAQVLSHFRYDPAVWEIEGVGSANPFGDKIEYVFFSAMPEPGVLVISCVASGSSAGPVANGKFAEISCKKLIQATRQPSTEGQPSGLNFINTIWYKSDDPFNPIQNEGRVDYCLDGMDMQGNAGIFGNPAFRNGSLTGDELTATVPDNCIQNIELDGYGATYRPTMIPENSITLKWTERIVGDYDNDGEVSVADITPIALCYNQDLNHFQSQGAIVGKVGYAYLLIQVVVACIRISPFNITPPIIFDPGRNVVHPAQRIIRRSRCSFFPFHSLKFFDKLFLEHL